MFDREYRMMNIQEATKVSMQKGMGMYRKQWREFGLQGELIPTNDPHHGLIYAIPKHKKYFQMVQLMAEDLIANDWIVVGEFKDGV